MMVLLPMVLDQIRVLTIPQIEHSDPDIHYIIDSFDLPVDEVLPAFIELKYKKSLVVGVRDEIKDEFTSTATMAMHEIHFDIQDVPFCFRRKTGFPKISDYGVADLNTMGRGISSLVKMDFYPDDTSKTLDPRDVSVYVDELNLKIRGAQHSFVFYLIHSS